MGIFDFLGGGRKAAPVAYRNPGGPVPELYFKMISETNVLIAGTTGAGKSVVIDGLIHAIAAAYTPERAVIWLIDPKRVDLEKWRKLPHVLAYSDTIPGALDMLAGGSRLMEKRFIELKKAGAVNWSGCHIYIIIDEIGDLMLSHKKQFLPLLAHLMQQQRAAGFSLICATQCPSRQVLPANISLLFNSALALRCRSPIESRQIIGQTGAELLPRHGVGIYSDADGVRRVAVPYTGPDEIRAILDFYAGPGTIYK